MPSPAIEFHRQTAAVTRSIWWERPLLREIYRGFFEEIAKRVRRDLAGPVVELGSGAGNLRMAIPDCVTTESFPDGELDGEENAYCLSFADGSVSNLILFDVFQYFRHPGTVLAEFARVLPPAGRVILFEPHASLLGRLVYGAWHPEPLGLGAPIQWTAPDGYRFADAPYYAGLGNATRIFEKREFSDRLGDWNILEVARITSLSYVLSGGYRGPRLYPSRWLGAMRVLDRLCAGAPGLFGTRLLVVLEKRRIVR